jgi:hypothetical protein
MNSLPRAPEPAQAFARVVVVFGPADEDQVAVSQREQVAGHLRRARMVVDLEHRPCRLVLARTDQDHR